MFIYRIFKRRRIAKFGKQIVSVDSVIRDFLLRDAGKTLRSFSIWDEYRSGYINTQSVSIYRSISQWKIKVAVSDETQLLTSTALRERGMVGARTYEDEWFVRDATFCHRITL